MSLPYFPPDRPDQLVTSFPDDKIEDSVLCNAKYVEKENGRTKQKNSKKRKAVTFERSEDKESDEEQKGNKFYQYHDM